MQPTILITRPKAQGFAFAAALEQQHGAPLPIVFAPLMRIEPVAPLPFARPDHVIFTSVNAVARVTDLEIPTNITAWCVGDQTAQAAQDLGFDVRNAHGTSDDLVALIKDAKPTGRITHFHGAHVTGRIVEQVSAAGLDCTGCVVYAQVDEKVQTQFGDLSKEFDHLIVPLFSLRSADLFARVEISAKALSLVVMSPAVAKVATAVPKVDVITANFPDKHGMITATLLTYREISAPKTP